jgi:hypothetical protein
MRPYGMILPIVYEVDTATKERWARYLTRVRGYNLTIAAFLLIFLTWSPSLEPRQRLWILLAYVLAVFVEQIWLHSTILRTARRVQSDRWTGPVIVDPLAINYRRTWAWLMVLFAVGTVTFTLVEAFGVWLAPHDPSIGLPWAGLPLLAVLAGLLAYCYAGFRRG